MCASFEGMAEFAAAVGTAVVAALAVEGLKAFASHFNGDQVWECGPAEVPHELKMLQSRKNSDNFPQGYDKCEKFLRLCAQKRWRFRIKAKKGAPWTWYYEAM